jgi:hypothetical protein
MTGIGKDVDILLAYFKALSQNTCQDSQFPSQEQNLGPSKFKAEVLITQL